MTCLHPTCQEEAVSRGLCSPHYAAVRRLVAAGEVTWAELEAQGKVLPKETGLRKAEVAEWLLGGGDGSGG